MNLFSKKIKAFTLIELLVSISIFAMMTTILMANYPNSLVRTNLYNLSNNALLLLREAQVKGSSIDSQRNASGVDTVTGYGIYFDKINNKFIYYADGGSLGDMGNKRYDDLPMSIDKTISTTNIAKGYYISNLFSYSSDAVPVKSPVDLLTINFTRPTVKAEISPNNASPLASYACIEFKTTKNPDLKRSIQVTSFGRITSSTNLCP